MLYIFILIEIQPNINIVNQWNTWNDIFKSVFNNFIMESPRLKFTLKDVLNTNIYLGTTVRNIPHGQPYDEDNSTYVSK